MKKENTQPVMKKENTEQVMVRYVRGGKEAVQYCSANGDCWIERHVDGKITIIKTFKIINNT